MRPSYFAKDLGCGLVATSWVWLPICWALHRPIAAISLIAISGVSWLTYLVQRYLHQLSAIHEDALRLAAYYELPTEEQQALANALWATLRQFIKQYDRYLSQSLVYAPLYWPLILLGGTNRDGCAWSLYTTYEMNRKGCFAVSGQQDGRSINVVFGPDDRGLALRLAMQLMTVGATVDDLHVRVDDLVANAWPDGLPKLDPEPITEPAPDPTPAA